MSEENNNNENETTDNHSEENNSHENETTDNQPEETTENIKEEAKSTANEFKEGWNEATGGGGENKKMLAGILGIVLGGFGAHKFVLGYNKEGFILLGILLISFPLMCVIVGAFTMYIPILIGLVEGIIYLTKSDEDFYETYQANKKPWF